jgi:transposase
LAVLVESLVRETLGVKDHKVVKVEGDVDGLRVLLAPRLHRRLICSGCGARASLYDTLPERPWRHVPLWGIPVTLVYSPRRVSCPHCGVKVEKVPWAEGKHRLTTPFVIVLATWARLLAVEVVAGLFGVSWSTVGSAVQQAVSYGLVHRELGKVLYIGVDEVSREKGHVYQTVVYDLNLKRLLWTGDGNGKETLERFFREWGSERTGELTAICCDMWKPYVEVIRAQAPDAVLVFDKFHLVKHLMEAVDTVRKEEARELKKDRPEILKGAKYIFLKNPENLTPKQKSRLSVLVKMNLKTNRAYLLKEAFRQVWRYKTKWGARRYLKKWFWWATHSRLKPLRDFAWLLRRRENNVLNWFEAPINNGSVEAMNNNAKAISHRSRGFRSAKWFGIILMHCLGKMPLPEFTHRFV